MPLSLIAVLVVGFFSFTIFLPAAAPAVYAAAPGGFMSATSLLMRATQTKAINSITVTSSGTEIAAANDLRIKIPNGFTVATQWDTTDTTATIGGTASAKVSATVSYATTTLANDTLVLDVTSDFAALEDVIISDLSIVTTGESSVSSGLQWAVDGSTFSATSGATLGVDALAPVITAPNLSFITTGCTGTPPGECIKPDTFVAVWNAGADGSTDVTSATFTILGAGWAATEDNGTPGSADCGPTPTAPDADYWCKYYAVTTYGGLVDGSITFDATALDGAGNSTGPVTSTATVAMDNVLPTITSAKTTDSNSNGKIDQLTVVYNQAVNDANYDAVAVTGYAGLGTGSGSGTITLVYDITESGGFDTGATPALTWTAANGNDVHGNILDITGAPANAADGAKPILVSLTSVTADGTYGPTSTINITANYSETVTGGSIQVDLKQRKE